MSSALVQNTILFVFLVLTSAFLTSICRKYVRIMDHASERSMHHGAVPRSGGLAIVITFCLGALLLYLFNSSAFKAQPEFLGVFISVFFIALVGFYDDITKRPFHYKLVSQLIALGILTMFGLLIDVSGYIHNDILAIIITYCLTSLWIVGITNAFNFMDGMNGMAGGVAVIVSIAFALNAIIFGNKIIVLICCIIAMSCVGFLFYNFPRASVFMGDVGSAFLGYWFGALALLAINCEGCSIPFMVMPILLANFVMETFFTFIWRLIRGQSIHKAHKLHPYQLLNQMGISTTTVTLIYYVQSIVLALLSLLYVYSSLNTRVAIVLSIIALYLVYFLAVHNAAREKGLLRRSAKNEVDLANYRG